MLTPLRLLLIHSATGNVHRIKNRTISRAYALAPDQSVEQNRIDLEHFRRHGPRAIPLSESALVFAAMARQLQQRQKKHIVVK